MQGGLYLRGEKMKPKYSNFIFAVSMSVMLSGCGTMDIGDIFKIKPKSEVVSKDKALDDLSQAAFDVRDEIKKLNDENGRVAAPSLGATGCSSKIVTYNLDGDVMLLIEDLRKSGICGVPRINGKKKHDLILSLHHKDVPLWQVLEDAGVQLGNLGSIAVTPDSVVFNFGVQPN